MTSYVDLETPRDRILGLSVWVAVFGTWFLAFMFAVAWLYVELFGTPTSTVETILVVLIAVGLAYLVANALEGAALRAVGLANGGESA